MLGRHRTRRAALASYPAGQLKGLPYEYWLLWPAPAHNAAMNHLYYNPQLNLRTRGQWIGSSYDAMGRGAYEQLDQGSHGSVSRTSTSVDLTQLVTVGQWCNSDWTQGNDDSGNAFVTNPGYCRTNGLVAAASANAPAATGDYMYPWAPAGITPNDFTTKVDMSAVSIVVTNAAVKLAWTGVQGDNKYFYENDNVLWCDITSPDWPQTGPTVPQTCVGVTNAQVCNPNPLQPTCTGAVGGSLLGFIAAGVCNGYVSSGTCAGFVQGVCSAGAGVCNGEPGVCSPPLAGNCSANGLYRRGSRRMQRFAARSLRRRFPSELRGHNGPELQRRNADDLQSGWPTHNGAGSQTCTNIVEIPPDPNSCTRAGIRRAATTSRIRKAIARRPARRRHSSARAASRRRKPARRTAIALFVNGTCSVAGNTCTSSADCSLKRCAGSPSGSCNVDTDCPATGGICSATLGPCTITGGVNNCPASGTCNNPPNAAASPTSGRR